MNKLVSDETLMNSKLNVLIIESNSIIALRLIDLLNELEEVDQVLYASSFPKAYKMLISVKVHVVLLGIRVTDSDILELLSVCKYDQHCTLIVLSDQLNDYYKERYKHLGIKYWLDKAHDFDMVPHLISLISVA